LGYYEPGHGTKEKKRFFSDDEGVIEMKQVHDRKRKSYFSAMINLFLIQRLTKDHMMVTILLNQVPSRQLNQDLKLPFRRK